MRDERRVPNHEEREAAIFEAKKEGGICAACGRVLAADEPVWRERLASRRGWSVYFRPAYRRAFVGRECATPETVEANEGQEPVACLGCGRGIHYAGAPASRRSTVCSVRCRVTVQRRQSKEGEPS